MQDSNETKLNLPERFWWHPFNTEFHKICKLQFDPE